MDGLAGRRRHNYIYIAGKREWIWANQGDGPQAVALRKFIASLKANPEAAKS